jgi:site-specific recombinase XerD
LEDEDKTVTAELLKNRYNGINETNVSFVELYAEHNRKLIIGKGFTKATHTRHETSMKHVVEFLQHKYKKNDILLREITPDFIKEYEHYLRTVRNCANNTTVKYIRNMGKILRLAEQKGILKKNPLDNLKYSIHEIDKTFLTDIELEMLLKKEFVSDRLTNIRDVFVFCSFTGLAFIDIKQLRKEDLSLGSNGEIIIRKQSQACFIMFR